MAETKFPFDPQNNNTPPFQKTVTLDGNNYILQAWFNLYAQRWYFTLLDSRQNRLKTAPLIASTQHFEINLTYNLFYYTALIYREDLGLIMVKAL